MNNKERREKRYKRRKEQREERKRQLNIKYGDYDKIISFESLVKAYYECKKGVSWKASVIKYGSKVYENSEKTSTKLKEGRYKQKPFVEFDLIERGKKRHIRSVHISDRVIQKSLCENCLTPILTNSFIYDNGASLKGKGTLFAIKRCEKHLHDHYRKYGNSGYIIIGDFKAFFDSLDHEIIYKNLKKTILDERVIDLIKRLVEPFGEKGLGLGSQVSQILAVNYPNRLDHFIKCECRIKGYGRYMDDFYVICKSKEQAKEILSQIFNICEELKLNLNKDKTQIVKLSHGFTFLKTKFNLTSSGKVLKRLTRANVARTRRKLKKFKSMLDSGKLTYEQINTSYNSWKGYAKHKDSYRTVKNMDKLYNELFINNWHSCQ